MGYGGPFLLLPLSMLSKMVVCRLPSSPEAANPPLTPLYDSLTTNLPHPVMAFKSFSFPPSTNLYPPASVVLTYLQDYTSHYELEPYIQLRTQVQSVTWDSSINGWEVQTKRTKAGSESEVIEQSTHGFDLVIVANGHYRLPYLPSTPGLQAWIDAGRASHSAWYRNPSHPYLKGNTILVVGAGPSGTDISTELKNSAGKTVVHSTIGSETIDLDNEKLKKRGEIREYLDPSKGEVIFVDGTREVEIGHAILATGYQVSFPFLEQPVSTTVQLAIPPPVPPLPTELYNSTHHVFPLAKQIFPIVPSFPPTSLAFIGLPYKAVPFPLAEAQCRAIVKVFETPSKLDLTKEAVDIISRYDEIRSSILPSTPESDIEVAIAKRWHNVEDDIQFAYRDALFEFVGGRYASEEWKVPKWVREIYSRKWDLRAAWKQIEQKGEADKLVRGIGEKGGEEGLQEWVELMRNILKKLDEGNETAARL